MHRNYSSKHNSRCWKLCASNSINSNKNTIKPDKHLKQLLSLQCRQWVKRWELTATGPFCSSINISTTLQQFIHDFNMPTPSSQMEWGSTRRFRSPCRCIDIHPLIQETSDLGTEIIYHLTGQLQKNSKHQVTTGDRMNKKKTSKGNRQTRVISQVYIYGNRQICVHAVYLLLSDGNNRMNKEIEITACHNLTDERQQNT